ncbi:hypothetical protein DAPPUDRAFT_102318 [Daphnia pulex]|uniref:Uncharacterized protein n=1 Tax=Daphnia pulex TaxID=6669 RepID=E9GG25_DAPPU|nr:hypothetical protein DAPPUDRAFT_102318 [Daphnia pulex]|eukprot:EFX81327.1 hypothetical protein DAPPUDRAFT_102318 [Daphnia pulex]
MVANINQFNGECGCGNCLDPGTGVKKQDDLATARILIHRIIALVPSLYGQENSSYNIYILQHLIEHVERWELHGPVHPLYLKMPGGMLKNEFTDYRVTRAESGDPKGGKGRRRGRGRPPRGSARLNQRGKTVIDARLQNIVDGIDVSETQRQLLEEEADDHQQSLDEAIATHEATEETSEVVEADMPRKDPPGEPIPQFTIQSWKASWRRAFFTDWRWSPKRKEGEAVKLSRYIPLNILRMPRFRQWVESGMIRYQLPSFSRMRNKLIPSVMDKTRLEVMKILQASTSITIILDICVNKEFERRMVFLGVKKMTERHTAENILAEYDQVAMVKTDGDSNMAANTFVNNIPGWDEEEQFPIEDSVLHPPIASASGVNPPNQEVEPMVEIEVSTTDDDNENIEDPLSMLQCSLPIPYRV